MMLIKTYGYHWICIILLDINPAKLFTVSDSSLLISKDWASSIISSIYKKVPKRPRKLSPIQLLSIISKHLFLKLWDWRESKNSIANEQSGFRTGRSTIDYYSVFQHLAEKYTARLCGALNPDFIALKSHFDSILLDKFWGKWPASSIACKLYLLYKICIRTIIWSSTVMPKDISLEISGWNRTA